MGAAAMVLLILIGLVMALRGSGNSTGTTLSPQGAAPVAASAAEASSSSGLNSSPGDLKRVTIDVPEGVAQVWEDGQLVGQTPFVIAKSYGDPVKLVLHQAGYEDLPVQFEVSQRSEYMYLMHRSDGR